MSTRPMLAKSTLSVAAVLAAVCLFPISIRAADAGDALSVTNLALGKPMRASSSTPGHPPSLAVDANISTYWASAGLKSGGGPGVVANILPLDPTTSLSDGVSGGADIVGPAAQAEIPPDTHNYQWIYVDLGATYALQQFRMQWALGNHARAYAVYVHQAACGWCVVGRTTAGDGDDTLTLRTPVHARYALLGLSYSAVPNGAYHLLEWQVLGASYVPPSDTNIALGRPSYASSQQVGHEAGQLTDGELQSEWRSARIPAWVYVDFGSPATLRQAVLRWSDGVHASRYALYAWLNGTWRAVYATHHGNGGDDVIALPPVSTRFLLLYGTAGPVPYMGLREMEVYGRLGAQYPTSGTASALPEEHTWVAAEILGERSLFERLPAIEAPAKDGQHLLEDPVNELPEIDAPLTDDLPPPA